MKKSEQNKKIKLIQKVYLIMKDLFERGYLCECDEWNPPYVAVANTGFDKNVIGLRMSWKKNGDGGDVIYDHNKEYDNGYYHSYEELETNLKQLLNKFYKVEKIKFTEIKL